MNDDTIVRIYYKDTPHDGPPADSRVVSGRLREGQEWLCEGRTYKVHRIQWTGHLFNELEAIVGEV